MTLVLERPLDPERELDAGGQDLRDAGVAGGLGTETQERFRDVEDVLRARVEKEIFAQLGEVAYVLD